MRTSTMIVRVSIIRKESKLDANSDFMYYIECVIRIGVKFYFGVYMHTKIHVFFGAGRILGK